MPLTESVYASVEIEPNVLYTVQSSVNGILENRMIKAGDVVAKGSTLFTLTRELAQLNEDRAALSYEISKTNYAGSAALLNELENDIQTAQLKLTHDSINFQRQKRLWDQNIGSRSSYDQLLLNYQISKKNVATLKNRYQRSKQDLENQINLAANQYQSSSKTKNDFSIKSKINGRVYQIFKEAGEAINLQEPLATIGSERDFIIVLQIDEVDIAKVKMDQTVLVNLEAYGDQVFEATIQEIIPNLDLRSRTFRVEAVFREPPHTLYPGLSGEANVIIARKNNALVIPLDYLVDDNMVLTESGKQKVQLGLKNMAQVEILSGIDSTTYLLKPE